MKRMTELVICTVTLLMVAVPANAQLGGLKKLKDKAKQKVEQRVDRKTDQMLEGALNIVERAVTDQQCIATAKQEGKQVKVVEGAAAMKPGQGAWANYDFKPGDRVLAADDFTRDEVGDFPRRFEFKSGNIEIVEWNGGRWLRSGNAGQFFVPLPEVMPERFTIEFDLAGGGNAMIMTLDGKDPVYSRATIEIGQYFASLTAAGVTARGEFGGAATDKAPVRISMTFDGKHVKLYANEKRVFNAPNAELGRSNKIFFNLNGWSDDQPRMIGNLRVAAGGKKLYDAIAEKGRVATQGIFFDFGSDRVRPESTPTLKEIAAMLNEHPELKLVIEGHTDNVGNAEANQKLSEKRAEAVRQQLISSHGIDAARLEAKGLGATKPAVSNDNPEGRQQNRRVELVRL